MSISHSYPFDEKHVKQLFDEKKHEDLFRYVSQAATQGNAVAQYWMGRCFKAGMGVSQDFDESRKWFKLSAEQGYADAQLTIGLFYYIESIMRRGNYYEEAFRWCKKAAEQGLAEAEAFLAYLYSNGEGTETNKEEAFRWYKLSAEQHHKSAEKGLGDCYFFGYGVEMNKEEAFGWYKMSAEQHDAVAELRLGDCYFYGYGTETNMAEAFRWYKLSAEQHNADAELRLGDCYFYGYGTETSKEEAFRWYKLSSEQYNADARLRLGDCYFYGYGVEINKEEAIELYTKAAHQDNADAQLRLGKCYNTGDGVSSVDYQRAFQYFQSAAEQGNAEAQYYLARFYALPNVMSIEEYNYYQDTGDITDHNLEVALKWYNLSAAQDYAPSICMLGRMSDSSVEREQLFRKAAEMGNADAQYELGYLYSFNRIGELNLAEAIKWFSLSAEQGHSRASYNLGELYSGKVRGIKNIEDKEKAAKWYKLSAEQGYPSAMGKIGICYCFGDGIEKDLNKALKWFTQAAEQGDEISQVHLGYFYERGIIVEKSKEEASRWFVSAFNSGFLDEEDVQHYLNRLSQELEPTTASSKADEKTLFEELRSMLSKVDHKLDQANQGINSANRKLDSIFELIQPEINAGRKQLEQVLQRLSENSLEAEQHISKAFQEMTSAIIERISQEKSSSNTGAPLEWLRALFGQNWNKLEEYTQKSLTSALVFLNQVHGDDLDYSGVVIAATSALENELKRYFFDGYQSYLSRVYGTPEGSDTKNWPRCMLYPKNENAKKFVPDEVFTIGSLPYIFGKKGNQNPEDADRLNEYLQTILVNPLVAKGIESFNEKRFIERCEQVRNDYRNKAAHTEIIKRESAQECCDKIIGSKNVGEIVSILYDLMQMIK